jgi:hypothetical protein
MHHTFLAEQAGHVIGCYPKMMGNALSCDFPLEILLNVKA